MLLLLLFPRCLARSRKHKFAWTQAPQRPSFDCRLNILWVYKVLTNSSQFPPTIIVFVTIVMKTRVYSSLSQFILPVSSSNSVSFMECRTASSVFVGSFRAANASSLVRACFAPVWMVLRSKALEVASNTCS